MTFYNYVVNGGNTGHAIGDRESLDDRESEINEEACLVCGEFGKNEIWLRCISCGQWAHKECTNQERKDYICDDCE